MRKTREDVMIAPPYTILQEHDGDELIFTRSYGVVYLDMEHAQARQLRLENLK